MVSATCTTPQSCDDELPIVAVGMPPVPPVVCAGICGPATVTNPRPTTPDICLPLGNLFDPTLGQTRWSLQPCTANFIGEAETHVGVAQTLPATGATETLAVGGSLLLVAGMLLCWFTRRPA